MKIKTIVIYLWFIMILTVGLNYYKRSLLSKFHENLKTHNINQIKIEAELTFQKFQNHKAKKDFAKFMGKEISKEVLFDHMKNYAQSCGVNSISADFNTSCFEQNYALQRVEVSVKAHHDRALYCFINALENSSLLYVWLDVLDFKRDSIDEDEVVSGNIKINIIRWRSS